LKGSIGAVEYELKLKSGFKSATITSRYFTGSSLSEVELKWFKIFPCFVQFVTDRAGTVSISMKLLFSLSH
jgi:hypothetical protein